MADKINYLSFIIIFWIFLTILSGYFEQDILKNNIEDLNINEEITPQDNNFITTILNGLDNIPIINSFTPLFRIMTFQYSKEIPAFLSIFLILFSILSAYLVYSMFRGY